MIILGFALLLIGFHRRDWSSVPFDRIPTDRP